MIQRPNTSISKLALIISLAVAGFQSANALESLSTEELSQINGKDGITVELVVQEDAVTNNDVSWMSGDSIRYTADDGNLFLSDFKIGAVNEWGFAGANKQSSIKLDLDFSSITYKNVFQPVLEVKASWGDINNAGDRLRFVSDLYVGSEDPNNTLGRLIYEGAGEVFLQTSGLTNAYATEYTNGYVRLKNTNIYLLNGTNNTGIGIRDFDTDWLFQSGSFAADLTAGGQRLFDYQSHFGIEAADGADGKTGLFVNSNRMRFDTNFVLTHIPQMTTAQFDNYRGQSLRLQQQDYFGLQFSGEIPNFLFKVGANSNASADTAGFTSNPNTGSEGIFFLVQAAFDDAQSDLALPDLAFYQPEPVTSANYYTTGENNELALRLDNFTQFHTNLTYTNADGQVLRRPALYLPITFDTMSDSSLNGGAGADGVRISLNDPSNNPDLGGAIIDLYIKDLNVGRLGDEATNAGPSIGGMVVYLNKINGTFDLFPAQSLSALNGNLNAQIAFRADASISDSGFGFIQTSDVTGSSLFGGIRDLAIDFLAEDPTQNYIGSTPEGIYLNLRSKISTNDFQLGVAKAFNSDTDTQPLINLGEPFSEEDLLLTARLYLNTLITATIKPTDNGFASIDATINFLGSSDSQIDTNQNLFYLVDPEEDWSLGLSNIQGAIRTAHSNTGEETLIGITSTTVNKSDGSTETYDSFGLNVPFEVVASTEGVNNLQGDFDVQGYVDRLNPGADDPTKNTLYNFFIPEGAQGRVNIQIWGQD
ncbi:MAG: hypothetical protein SVC26_04825 [Pseudomonadota bacterium]|nr:hypothetical protein [Pseudomonadota bacterium]